MTTSRTEKKRKSTPISTVGGVPGSRRVIEGLAEFLSSVLGTPNQITVTVVGDTIVLSTPQNINVNADVVFDTITIDDILSAALKLNIHRDTANKTIDATAYQWHGNTDGGGFAYTLPAGVQDRQYKVVNTGSSGNVLSLIPAGAEYLLGANTGFALEDGEALMIAYDATDGWY